MVPRRAAAFEATRPMRLRRRSGPFPIDLQAVQDFNRSMVLIVDPEALRSSIAARVLEISGASHVLILQPEAERPFFAPVFVTGIDPNAANGAVVPKRGRLARWLLTNEACLVVGRDAEVVRSLDDEERQVLSRLSIRVCVPLVALNRLVGLILLGSERPGFAVAAERLELLQLLAAQAGLAFENALLHREQRDRLRRLDRAERLAVAGQLAAGVAHEIRNPLTSIRSTVQYLLRDYPEGEPKRALVEEVLSEVDRIDRIVGGLLGLARSPELDVGDVDLPELLEQSLVLVAVQAKERGVSVERGAWEPVTVRGDARQLRQVFLNILLNALQAMPGGGTLTVGLERRRRPDVAGETSAWAAVTVEDTGAGIPKEQLERVFDPFFTTKRDGTGLGLSVSWGIVQRHDGELDLTSEPGRGTRVAVRLPAAEGNR